MFLVHYGMLEAVGCNHGHQSQTHDVRPYSSREQALAAILVYCGKVTTQIRGTIGLRYYSSGHKFADLIEREVDSAPFTPIEGDCIVDSCNITSVLP